MNALRFRFLAALVALLSLFSAPPALAGDDAPFDSMAVAAYATRHTEAFPEQLRAYVQPVGKTFCEGALKLHWIDAIFVDGVVIAAWTVQNTGDAPLYLLDEASIGEYQLPGYVYHGFGGILAPGETRNCGIAGYLEEAAQADGQTLAVSVAGLRLMGEAVDWGEVGDGTLYETDRGAYDREVDRLFAQEGKIVIEGGGYMAQGSGGYGLEEGMEPPHSMYGYIAGGKLSLESRLSMEAPLRQDHALRSVLPEVPVEMPYGEGVMRLTRADVSPAWLVVEAAFVFPNAQAASAFHDPHDPDEAPPIDVVDPRGVRAFYGMGSAGFVRAGEHQTQMTPDTLEDGTVAWTYRCEYVFLAPAPSEYYILLDTGALSENWTDLRHPVRDFEGALHLTW